MESAGLLRKRYILTTLLQYYLLNKLLKPPGHKAKIILVGAQFSKQAIENAKADDINLSAEDISFINNELSKLKLIL